MTPNPKTRDREHLLTNIATALTARLHTLGVNITTSPLPTKDVARFDPHTTTLHIRPGNPDSLEHLEDRVWILSDLMTALVHGVDCAYARPTTRLALVS